MGLWDSFDEKIGWNGTRDHLNRPVSVQPHQASTDDFDLENTALDIDAEEVRHEHAVSTEDDETMLNEDPIVVAARHAFIDALESRDEERISKQCEYTREIYKKAIVHGNFLAIVEMADWLSCMANLAIGNTDSYDLGSDSGIDYFIASAFYLYSFCIYIPQLKFEQEFEQRIKHLFRKINCGRQTYLRMTAKATQRIARVVYNDPSRFFEMVKTNPALLDRLFQENL